MVTAMRNGKPDRVPVSSDMSNMIPARQLDEVLHASAKHTYTDQ